MILTNEGMAAYHQVRNDIEDCLTGAPSVTPSEAKNHARRLMEMFTTKGYALTGGSSVTSVTTSAVKR